MYKTPQLYLEKRICHDPHSCHPDGYDPHSCHTDGYDPHSCHTEEHMTFLLEAFTSDRAKTLIRCKVFTHLAAKYNTNNHFHDFF